LNDHTEVENVMADIDLDKVNEAAASAMEFAEVEDEGFRRRRQPLNQLMDARRELMEEDTQKKSGCILRRGVSVIPRRG
jgi:hypothetical protein